ncbi:MAG: hypothetical protein ACODAU_11060 [Myxococcota bacterium]
MTDMKQVRGQVEGSLSNAGRMLKIVRLGLLGLGGFLVLYGLYGLVSGGLAAAMGPLIGGAMTIGVALFVLPRFTGMISSMTSQIMPSLQQLEQNQSLLQTGLDGTAKIVSAQETGQYINMQPQVQLVLDVAHPNGQGYQVTTLALVSQLNMPRVQPGADVPVKIDPADPQQVAVVL